MSQTSLPRIHPVPHRDAAAEVVLVTVAMAYEFLERNTKNRDLNSGTVAAYAADMIAGRWKFNGGSIVFGENGQLLDGQHRLWAIIESGIPQTFVIVRNVATPAQLTMDQGRRRTPKDQLHLVNIKGSNSFAAAINTYIEWMELRFFGNVVNNKVTTTEKVEFAQNHPDKVEILRSVESVATRVPCRPSLSLAVSLRLHEVDYSDADDFFSSLVSGANLGTDSPILALRNRLLRIKETKVSTTNRDLIGFFVTAWNAEREGRRLTKLQRPTAGWTRETFPSPR